MGLNTNSEISLYSINWLVFITEECVYWTVRFASLNISQIDYGTERIKNHFWPKQVNINFSQQILVQLMNKNNNNNTEMKS